MMKKRAFLFFVVVFAFSISPVAAQRGKSAEIRRIDAYVRTLDALVKKNKRPHLIFADAAGDAAAGSRPKWRKFASQAALDKFRQTTETYTIAYNWRRRGRIVRANFTLFSPSGDWAHYVYHDFRADGTLARLESEMRTFNGDLIITQNFYFDRRGALLKKTVKYRDLQTGKPIEPTPEFLENKADFSDNVEYYKKTSKLPFADLLKTTKK